MDYRQQITLARTQDFYERVMQAMIEYAITVSKEESSGDYDVDQRRVKLAQDVLRRSTELYPRFSHAVATIVKDGEASDADLKGAVASVWNAFACLNPRAAKPGTVSDTPKIDGEFVGSESNVQTKTFMQKIFG